ncbi:His-Xaa-Ser system radical SAM maturase HxsB [uncultured Duncaniella sp.]|jgi:His-Xaa-Ser system radical SAM maturase HxsB|uniref:His-Xaa-Ser system radical SAM maturase HxsB n=1 Tax=uncultured Duncaniella sp. TaxID=2768039 RepID=UPI0026769E74|nr:His-Xaa-Ser system radical SAM maturase HxsB [uncultured Duncaniella sp.]
MTEQPYYLLPFDFTEISGKEVLVNELGDMIVSPKGTVQKIVDRSLPKNDLYKSLVSNFFISEQIIPPLVEVYAERLREKKRFLESWTGLHIFVMTLRCNQNCVYCQASSQNEDSIGCSMNKETMAKGVELMFRSPSDSITMEFQGGEPTLVPDVIEYGIQLAEEKNKTANKDIHYVLCTNSISLTDRMLEICKKYGVVISTSLDGPAFLHNANRGKIDSYEKVVAGIAKGREAVGHEKVSALMTTSVEGLNYPIEIVDEYVKLGFRSMFLRALNPYGLATHNDNWSDYTNRFIEFYKKAFEHILDLNRQGTYFVEEFAAIILRKILTPYCTGFVDLQSPAGVINSVLVYNYDGGVYCSDESRMLAEFNNYTFRLGSVNDRYEDLVFGKKAKEIANVWANEALAGCSDCAIKQYCGADPVRNYSTQGDMYGNRATSLLCRKNKAIIEYLISLMIERPEEVMPIFRSWGA